MYQEQLENERSSRSDILIIVLTVVLISVIEVIAVVMSKTVPSPLMLAIQGVVVLAVIALCIFFYCFHIVSIRYSYITGDFSELTGEQCKELEMFEIGTFFVERLVGDVASTQEEVVPSEMKAFLLPSEDFLTNDGRKVRKVRATMFSKRTAHKLVYLHNNVYTVLYLHPSTKLCELLTEATKQ